MEYPISNPVGLDKALASIGDSLCDLPWLDKIFGRAFLFAERTPQGRAVDTPKVYTAGGEYANVFPNDIFGSFSFFWPLGYEEYEDMDTPLYGSSTVSKRRRVALILWVNLKKIDPVKDYVFTEELKRQIEKLLARNPYVRTIDRYIDEDVQKVYDGFDLDENALFRKAGRNVTQWLMYPYAGMRFELTLGYADNC